MKYAYQTICLALLLCGCTREDANSHIESVSKGFDDTYNAAKDSVKELPAQTGRISDAAGEEVSKLHTLEYKVFELPFDTPSHEIENHLAILGSDRWDCFFIRPFGDTLQIFCKRHPKTFLRYIPKIF